MKVTLDLTRLLEEGRITREEHDRLLALGAAHTGSLAFNILIAFGVVAVSAGLIALVPDPTTGIVLGLVLLGGGLAAYGAKLRQWDLLAHICVLIGALGLAGGLVALTLANAWAFAAIAVGFAVVGALSGSGLLVALAVLALSSVFGARTDYMHATYFLGIEEPTLTILVFAALALATYLLSQRVPAAYERLALIAARTSLFLVNFGFWIGSLWGDTPTWLGFAIGDLAFSIAWAVALVATGIWAAQANRPWVVNIVAVFAAIHFYTQWFERLGPEPLSILVAGLIALGIAIGLWNYNRSIFGGGTPPAGAAA
jgi:hypothetical protein